MLPEVISFGERRKGRRCSRLAGPARLLDRRPRSPSPALTVAGNRVVEVSRPAEEGGVARNAYVFCVLTAVPPAPQAPRDLRRSIDPVAGPPPALLEGLAWSGCRAGADRPGRARRARRAASRSRSGHWTPPYREVGGDSHPALARSASNSTTTRLHLTGRQGHRGAAVPGRPARADDGHAAARRPARGDPGGHVLGAGARGGVHRGLRRPVPAGGPADLDRRVPGRPRDERRLPADRQEGRPGAGAVAAVARLPELRPARDPGAPANAPLVARQAGLPLAQAWGGGLVAAVDGMRFVVPVPAAFARPNRKFFGSKAGHDLAQRHQ